MPDLPDPPPGCTCTNHQRLVRAGGWYGELTPGCPFHDIRAPRCPMCLADHHEACTVRAWDPRTGAETTCTCPHREETRA